VGLKEVNLEFVMLNLCNKETKTETLQRLLCQHQAVHTDVHSHTSMWEIMMPGHVDELELATGHGMNCVYA
jgi:hypothetical protein